jgi:hypothetical protein
MLKRGQARATVSVIIARTLKRHQRFSGTVLRQDDAHSKLICNESTTLKPMLVINIAALR